jgi:hypothetical protein
MKLVTRTGALAVTLAALGVAGCSASAPPSPPGTSALCIREYGPKYPYLVGNHCEASPSTASTAASDITVACAPVSPQGGIGMVPQVTMTTAALVNGSVSVTVIDFDAAGNQLDSQTISIGDGPFAPDQTFTRDGGVVFTNNPANNGTALIASCAIASVNSDDQSLTYDNLTPVPGATG